MKLTTNLWQLKKNYAADKHSPTGHWNVENLHYNWIVMRQLVGYYPRAQTKVKLKVKTSSMIVYFVEEYENRSSLIHGNHLK